MTTGFNITEDGRWVSAEHQRIAQIIHDYDPTLSLAWVPPENRTLNEEHPFAVVGVDKENKPYVVMRLRESEVDHRVLERLWSVDNAQGNVLSNLEAKEAALRAIELQKQIEDAEEAAELAAWAIKAPTGARHNGMRLV